MLEEYCGWTRGVDWGNAPSWATIVVATVVGAFTVANIRLARKAYTEGAFDRKVAQARRVYGDSQVQPGQFISKGSESDWFRRFQSSDDKFGSDYLDSENDSLTGERVRHATVDLYASRAEVVNNSDEPVGGVVIKMIASDGTEIATDSEMKIGTLRPNARRSVSLLVPFSTRDASDPAERPRLVLLFTDSAGHRWERIETYPPTEPRTEERVKWVADSASE